jgi:mono/diheme cytochrome c family protein
MGSYEDRQRWILGGGVLLFLGIAVGFGYGLAGCHRVPPMTPQEADGKHLYSVRCAHCHEDNDLALKKVPPDLHDVFTRTTIPSGAPATDREVRRVVLSGKGMMPSFAGRFTDEQMAALIAYVHTGLR